MKTKSNHYNKVLNALRENYPQKKATAIGFRFRANTIEFSGGRKPSSFLNRDDIPSPHTILLEAFPWGETPEGFDYWSDIWLDVHRLIISE